VLLFPDGSISPAAADSLLVKDEIAQPAHEADEDPFGWGVLILGPELSTALGGGRTESGMLADAFRIFCI
jgi:hypothetical protein